MQGRDNRLFIEAVFWYMAARRWRDLPPEFGKWNTAYMRFRRWNLSGSWHRLAEEVQDDAELQAQFEKIVAHANRLRQRAIQKASKNGMRQAYNSLAFKSSSEQKSYGSEIEASSDWLRLVMGPDRQRIIRK